jgi:riboflavin kinase / FMN adenylyltransferase
LKILELNDTITSFPEGTVVTMGNFDGVHKGHVALIRAVETYKGLSGLPSVLVTYSPNPSIILGKNKDLKSIFDERKKQELLSEFQLNYLLTIPFTEEFSLKKAQDFLEEILVRRLHARHIVIGYNHFFGKDREGDFSFLQSFADKYNFTVEQISPVYSGTEKISSSLIRSLLAEGFIERANEMLGRSFSVRGTVVKGNELGRTISFPTANINPSEQAITPGRGVYACYTIFDGHRYPSMVNIGNRPTFDGQGITIEAHILDFKGDLYGKEIEHQFLYRIRDEQRFDNVGELVTQLHRDRDTSLNLFRQNSQMAQQQ